MSEKFTLGVNYWPRRTAMYWWSNFDAGEVRKEFYKGPLGHPVDLYENYFEELRKIELN